MSRIVTVILRYHRHKPADHFYSDELRFETRRRGFAKLLLVPQNKYPNLWLKVTVCALLFGVTLGNKIYRWGVCWICTVDTGWRKSHVLRTITPEVCSAGPAIHCDYLETFCVFFIYVIPACYSSPSRSQIRCWTTQSMQWRAWLSRFQTLPSDEFREQIFQGFNRFFIPSPLTTLPCLCVQGYWQRHKVKKKKLPCCGYPVEHRWVIATSPFSSVPIRYLLVITAHHSVEGGWG
jgi:hypothetical protein